MAESRLRDLSTDSAVKVIKMCAGIKGQEKTFLSFDEGLKNII